MAEFGGMARSLNVIPLPKTLDGNRIKPSWEDFEVVAKLVDAPI
jgi:hypothetical protein